MHDNDEPPEPPDPTTEKPETDDIGPDALRLFNRSPHPYFRRSASLRDTERPKDLALPEVSTSFQERPIDDGDNTNGASSSWRPKQRASQSSSDSGSEADDESYNVIKALPPAPIKPRKGLRDLNSQDDGISSPALSPTEVDEEEKKLASGYFQLKRDGSRQTPQLDDEAIAARQRFIKRRRAELMRRTTEVALSGAIALTVLQGVDSIENLYVWHRVELLSHIWIVPALAALYFTRLLFFRHSSGGKDSLPLSRRIKIPAAFDPATLLYPVLLPVFIPISMFPGAEHTLLPNLILSLSAIPPRLIPIGATGHSYNMLQIWTARRAETGYLGLSVCFAPIFAAAVAVSYNYQSSSGRIATLFNRNDQHSPVCQLSSG